MLSRHRFALSLLALAFLFLSSTAFAQEEWFTPSDEDAILAAAARIGGSVSVGIELVDEPTAVVYAKALKNGQGHGNANGHAKQQLGKIKAEQQKMLAKLKHPSINARVFFETQRTFNGFGAFIAADKIDEIRALPGVASVHLLVPQTPSNAGSVPFIGTPALWVAGSGANAGQGIRIGIIDSGVDYIHTNMGGPGSGYGANNTKLAGDTPGVFPGAKVVGGWDFAGDSYDAGSTNPAVNTPQPDPDPMDCGGHGSHVAGSAAGYGVRSDGSTFPGPYDGSTPFSFLKIGPGVAPMAQLYALRVFGCSGSTLLTAAAIEWAVDPNGDGDFSDHLDVINMSLGAAFGSSFDASATASQNAALAGVIVVVAAGNNGDTHYTVGSPGTATRALTVAASQDNGSSALRVNAPSSIAGLKAIGKASGWGGALTDPGVTAPVVATVPADACSAVTNLAAVAGKIAFVDRGGVAPGGAACGFELKAKNAQNAGAVGVIIGNVASSASPLIPPGMASGAIGGVTIPAVSLGLTEANQIRGTLGSGVNVTILRSATGILAPVGDLAASFTSRGIRRLDNALKPDIAAPGVTIESTAVGTGSNAFDNNGTSMATPHVAGMMALLRQLHPDWSVEELKALAMNTAAKDLFFNLNQAPPRYGVARAGAGRADLAAASSASVIAMNTLGDGSVSVSFGAIEVLGSYSGSKTIQVVNKGATTQTYSVSLQNTQSIPGVAYSLPGGSSVTVAPGETATLTVGLSATAAAMKHSLDTTMSLTQTNTGGSVLNRHYLSEQSAYVVLTPSSGPTLRVPVHAILRPASAMGTTQTAFLLAGASGTNTINLAGTHVNTGAAFPVDERSVVSALELAGTSPQNTSLTAARSNADIKAVGISTDFKQRGALNTSVIYFGVATYGKWTTLLDVEFDIYVDRDRNGTDDVVFFNTTQNNGQNRLDVHGTSVLNAVTGAVVPGSVFSFINGVNANLHTVAYNSNVIVLPVRAVDLGLSAANSRFNYRIVSFARGTAGGSVDTFTGTYDPQRPGLNFNVGFTGAPIFFDLNGGSFPVQYNTADLTANGSQGVLLLHHHNADGAREQILQATAPSATTTTVGAKAGQYSDVVTLTASVTPASFFGQTISGSVQFSVGGTPVGSAPVDADGNASLAYTIGNAAGSYAIAATFTSTNSFFLGSSGSSTLTVTHENALVVPSNANAASVQVSSPGGAASFALSADIAEVGDGSLGNIALASPVTVTLTPLANGSPITQTATLVVSGSVLTATASFTNVPVNVYDVTYTVGGAYYTGGAAGIVAVFDPSLGDVTGGGTIFRNGVRANFGFNVKYQKNGNAQGQFVYIEHRPTGTVKVKSNSLGTLSIAGDTAIILGKANVEGMNGNHDFRLTVTDNGEPGSSDQFGLVITGVPDLTFAPITLSGGNIQVP